MAMFEKSVWVKEGEFYSVKKNLMSLWDDIFEFEKTEDKNGEYVRVDVMYYGDDTDTWEDIIGSILAIGKVRETI